MAENVDLQAQPSRSPGLTRVPEEGHPHPGTGAGSWPAQVFFASSLVSSPPGSPAWNKLSLKPQCRKILPGELVKNANPG